MIEFPIIFYVLLFLCGVLFVIRNVYYFKLWIYRKKFDSEDQRTKVFGLGIRKFMFPITLDKKASDPFICKTIKMVNIFNYLMFLLYILAIVSFFNYQNA